MVPVRLTLQNFLSYGESCSPIELDGIHVACLCGPNGHGKSALLDAITWALWGQARTSSADELVRLGQGSMLVELDFVLDNQLYRVIRKRTRGKNSQSDLQFQVESEPGVWRALTGEGLKGTQKRINQALRMDYETFINSAFILQGRADEFARKTPGDRKRILGEILSLGVYDELCDAARARLAEARMRVASLEQQISKLEQDRAQLPQLRSMVEPLQAQHQAAQLAAAQKRLELQEVCVEKAKLDHKREQRDDLVKRLARAEADLNTLRQQLAGSQSRAEAFRKLVAQAGEIRARAQEHQALSRERDELTGRLQELRRLEQEKALLDRQYEEERYRLSNARLLAQNRLGEVNARARAWEAMQSEVRDLTAQVEALDRLQEERAALQQRLQELAGLAAEARAEQTRCSAELEKAGEVFRLLKEASTASCPVCSGDLPDAKRKELGWQYRKEMDDLKALQAAAVQKETQSRREDGEARQALQVLEAKLKKGQQWRDRLAQARQTELQAEEALKEVPALTEALAALDEQLSQETFAPELKQQREELAARIKSMQVDDGRQRLLETRLKALATADRDLHALETAERDLPNEEHQSERLQQAINQAQEAIQDDVAARVQADHDLARLPAVDAQERKLRAELEQTEREETEKTQLLAQAVQRIEQLEAMGPQVQQLKAAREEAAQDQAAFDELARAFGRNGIQALIIENALPEIENEANLLLSRMSNGQFNIRLVTQREKKSGGAAETLEIKIDDGGAERPYELYSGGEAFRINFALRIALSKLLARRAGARLETLVIDEGFGSQDQEGRQRLIEAIQAVQEDFARVLVITHIDELKEAFPTRIEVTKGLGGSQVAIY